MRPRPLVVAFDTSGSLGSVAVAEGSDVIAREFLTRRGEHAAHLVPMVRRALASVGATAADIAEVVVGSGPGSFTGVRVAAATAKGLVRSLGVPLWPVSSLAAAAASAEAHLPFPIRPGAAAEDGEEGVDVLSGQPPSRADELQDLEPKDVLRPRFVLFDARGDRVYAGCYQFLDGGIENVVPPRPARMGGVIEEGAPPGTFFCGDGALRHSEALMSAGHPVLALPAGIPTAEGLLQVHRALGSRPPETAPGRWEPEYLRAWKGVRLQIESAT